MTQQRFHECVQEFLMIRAKMGYNTTTEEAQQRVASLYELLDENGDIQLEENS